MKRGGEELTTSRFAFHPFLRCFTFPNGNGSVRTHSTLNGAPIDSSLTLVAPLSAALSFSQLKPPSSLSMMARPSGKTLPSTEPGETPSTSAGVGGR
jgi:hypothetical protein